MRRHLYVDTSDLNAPYDQWRGARSLQGLGAAKHLYMDYSNLNAQYDRSRPAIHGLGGGSLGGSALGNVMGRNTGLGLASMDRGCQQLTSAHGRMLSGSAAMSGDEELLAKFENYTGQFGCPVRGSSHWFWPSAPTSQWLFRGKDKFVEDDWTNTASEWTLYVPPFAVDHGKTYVSSQTAPNDNDVVDTEIFDDTVTPELIRGLQSAMNVQLKSLGCRPVAVDGKSGKETCGALAYIIPNHQLVPEMEGALGPYLSRLVDECERFEYSCSGGEPDISTTTPPHLPSSVTGGSGVSTNALLIGGAVAVAAALVGGAYYYKQRYG